LYLQLQNATFPGMSKICSSETAVILYIYLVCDVSEKETSIDNISYDILLCPLLSHRLPLRYVYCPPALSINVGNVDIFRELKNHYFRTPTAEV